MELDSRHIDVLDALAANREGAHFNKLKNIIHLPAKTLMKKKKELEEFGLIYLHSRGRQGKKNYRITEKGFRYLTEYNIRIRYGLVGLKWAEEALKKGYKARFLSDFTGLEGHDKLLLAWHPIMKDVKIAEIFGVGEFGFEPSGPGYVGQYVNRKIKPDGPIRHATLRDFIKNHVKNFNDEAEIGTAVKKFFDEHNAFMAVLLPQEITFGFPKRRGRVLEVGRFSSLMFIGFKGEGDVPFIPKMDIIAGGFNLSENLKVILKYAVNLMALYTFAWLTAKQQVDPSSVNKERLNEWLKNTWLCGLNPHIEIACKNGDKNGNCKKLGKCIALEEREKIRHLNFKKCPILIKDVEQVKIQ